MQPRLAAADSPKERPAACTHRRNLRPPDDRRRRNSAHLYARDLRARTVIGPTGEVEGGTGGVSQARLPGLRST